MKFNQITRPLIALLVLPTGGIKADDWLALERDQAVRNALGQNLELRVAEFEIARAKARLRWSGKLAPPEIELSANTDQFGLDDNESVLEIGIAQKFPVTDRLKREEQLSRVQVALAEAEVAEARRKLISAVERNFVSALSAQEQVTLLKEIEDLIAGFVKILERQAAQGQVSRLDVNQAKLDDQKIGKDLLRQQSEARRLLGSLKSLLGVSNESRLSLNGNLALPENGSNPPDIEAARNRRPDFQKASLEEDVARAELALATANRWEDVAVRLFAEREASVDAPDGLERNTFVGVGVSIPLPLKKERATAEPAVAAEQAEANSRAVALKIENEIAAAIGTRNDLLELARASAAETLPLAEKNLEEISTAYRNGQIELVKFQRAQEQLLEARLSALEARASYHSAEIDLREAAALHPGISPNEAGK